MRTLLCVLVLLFPLSAISAHAESQLITVFPSGLYTDARYYSFSDTTGFLWDLQTGEPVVAVQPQPGRRTPIPVPVAPSRRSRATDVLYDDEIYERRLDRDMRTIEHQERLLHDLIMKHLRD